jgi:acetyl-CoA C-acetyltransferase
MAHAVTAALARAGRAAQEVAELAVGVNFPGSDRSVARQASLHAGLPETTVSYTVDRACCSSLAAIDLAARSVATGTGLAVAGGTENLSRVPYFLEDMRWGNRLGHIQLVDQLVVSCPYTGVPRAVQASEEAAANGIGRTAQDEWALRSQQRWAQATARGAFADEIVPIPTDRGDTLSVDECPRPTTTLAALAALPTVNGSATVTAGNAPGLATGATAVVLAPAAALPPAARPLAWLRTIVAAAGPPERIASIPAVAARMALAAAGLELDDIALFEINEAFAAVPLVSTKVLADGDAKRTEWLRERTNVNGGAIAVGHPTGATGARLLMTLAFELRRRGGGFGLVSICGGIGEAHAAVIEVPADG